MFRAFDLVDTCWLCGKSSGEFSLGGDLKPGSRERLQQLVSQFGHHKTVMRLYVGNLSFSTTENDLQDAFERFGTVTDVKIMMDQGSGRSRGFGFVTMGGATEGEAAIGGLHEQDLDGRKLTVNEARPREERGGGGGSRGGERAYSGGNRRY